MITINFDWRVWPLWTQAESMADYDTVVRAQYHTGVCGASVMGYHLEGKALEMVSAVIAQ